MNAHPRNPDVLGSQDALPPVSCTSPHPLSGAGEQKPDDYSDRHIPSVTGAAVVENAPFTSSPTGGVVEHAPRHFCPRVEAIAARVERLQARYNAKRTHKGLVRLQGAVEALMIAENEARRDNA